MTDVKTYPKGRGRNCLKFGKPVIRIARRLYHSLNGKEIRNVIIYFYSEAADYTNIANGRTCELFEHGSGFAFRLYPDKIKSKGYMVYKVGSSVMVYAPAIWNESKLPDGYYQVKKNADFYELKPINI